MEMRGHGSGFGMPTIGIPANSMITSVQQKEYSAGIWLRRKDKLEHSPTQAAAFVLSVSGACLALSVAALWKKSIIMQVLLGVKAEKRIDGMDGSCLCCHSGGCGEFDILAVTCQQREAV
ncbi:Inactive phospholipase D5 [Liparis tanakae]|uniref:Inactive phospholipase D5 n=1 Tax=Liparis tanakae TaxID=230148 RepID=A0A4Z2HDU4_9TELE|nr:Inactive phospholipase D5 [Liparis tanakae]